MEDKITELLKQAPQSAALIIVFILLIRYLTSRDKIAREYDREKDERFAKMFESASDQARVSTDRNTATLERLASATDKNTYEISSLSRSIDKLASTK